MGNHAVFLRNDHDAGIGGGFVFHARGHDGRFGNEQRHGLTLHVGTHQRAVCVVVFEEGDHGRCNRNELLGRNVHIVHFGGFYFDDLVEQARDNAILHEPVELLVDRLVGLRHDEVILFVRGQILDLVGNHVLFAVYAAVRRFDEAVLVDARIGRKRVDESDVRTFRRFNGAHAAVMTKVHVAYVKRCALAVQAARAERRKTALMGQFRQRVCLIHELAQLGGTEEFLDRRRHGADVN
ncbi:hypothetical protein SDC9_100213 [bioreactor metagenome]|uniref:Uncharacterized protein n=1 Tax=bioreactor metagenome TaxID=1076179 RepID=A0A645AJP6_9ZZZZ